MPDNIYKSKYSGEEVDAILDYAKSNLTSPITKQISVPDWSNGVIQIPFEDHNIKTPQVAVFMLNGGLYETVLGSVVIDSSSNITIKTDLPFEGKIIIK